MTFRTVTQALCLLLLLATQFLMAQHATVHPVETGVYQTTSHADADTQGGDQDHASCDLCQFISFAGHAITGPALAVLIMTTLFMLVREPAYRAALRVQSRTVTYSAQAPPILLS